ncbi:SMP-30/gluconolactonase/LRE family protein [Pontibacter sp. JH31]|uniref:SMP-30/gluconolactonase/LRE family protein n=1 Tax=Pontibacter aquaedesilientis TaxID=2766980 RepID=A0ABR7XGZ2_9BACT|nr:SMP-30/gluconolactonase/LRE family protein [Pontibacter aquaedesilientis]MBD1397547.1 SMP-30/gluconolactonase/LRE family protein [Pontibacter aquaedesilientis]
MSKPKQNTEMDASLVLDARATLGEGAIWHPVEELLYWVDIECKELHVFDPVTMQDEVWPVGARIGTVVPVVGGGALVALQNGIHRINTETGELRCITNPLQAKDIRFNDGKCDPAGRFWVGTMALDSREGAAVLYRMDRDGSIHQMLDKLSVSNGLVWTADKKTMYFIDTPTCKVQRFAYDNETGAISYQGDAIRIPESEGKPDGMTIDSAGNLWIALYGGGAVGCWNTETGALIQKITVPAPHTTSCAFGGEDLATLFITSARDGLDSEQLKKYPQSGGIFAVKPGVQGVPAELFRSEIA